ncbi:hypothetical protein JIG36_43590 [Actinoplanes sp. LDG1-06]|uniref:Uncharacterized protein n=1 Tax=Paractinoplanes ovalisporus TaxID=2810368 RepID=A0ABS2ARC6_9ACTN|nr:hypothetical protein [Actinoplanes ovalisporus]MBM2622408.1 hypothetical protein [Actinoplanes ovalisporus]
MFMRWLRRRFRALGGVADAVSHADTGPYAGAPRNPELRVGDEKSYSTVIYTADRATTQAGSWLDESQMPAARQARRRARRHVV